MRRRQPDHPRPVRPIFPFDEVAEGESEERAVVPAEEGDLVFDRGRWSSKNRQALLGRLTM